MFKQNTINEKWVELITKPVPILFKMRPNNGPIPETTLYFMSEILWIPDPIPSPAISAPRSLAHGSSQEIPRIPSAIAPTDPPTLLSSTPIAWNQYPLGLYDVNRKVHLRNETRGAWGLEPWLISLWSRRGGGGGSGVN